MRRTKRSVAKPERKRMLRPRRHWFDITDPFADEEDEDYFEKPVLGADEKPQ